MKHVLSIQDLSCTGRCSLTVALPILSVMGCRCTVLPTTVLSSHTGFPDPHRRGLTEHIAPIVRHWKSLDMKFDAIGVGYLADPQQAEAVEQVIDTFPALTVVDPAMGDHGRLYSSITPEHVQAMAGLCRKGNVLLPNVTEAALLTGIPYRETPDAGYLKELTAGMLGFGADAVVITGVSGRHGTIGFCGEAGGEAFSYEAPCIQSQFHGTGDMFAAVLLGAMMAGKPVQAAAALAAGFVERTLANSGEPTPHGAKFETQLPWLWEQI
ncbi:MAG: bifunctional hydroxymethylpyrimidine kinase/phosphomethylpyrimidine kinase [Oscillospiraceae bacterium]|nr:bifunctional hydroxymethylpyrimidine kinase/phosphomethylpyrimidine kinase [Oscillospiraceae bacterium]